MSTVACKSAQRSSVDQCLCLLGFAEKVKAGKATGSGSGFGGKGLERLDQDREAHSRLERAAYGEPGAEKKEEGAAAKEDETPKAPDVHELQVEIKKGPAPPDKKLTSGGGGMAADKMADTAASLEAAKAAEAAAIAAGKPAGVAKAQSLIANFNAMLKARTSANRSNEVDHSTESARRRDPDATDYHVSARDAGVCRIDS